MGVRQSGIVPLPDVRDVLDESEKRLKKTAEFTHSMRERSLEGARAWADLAAALAALGAWLWDASDALQMRIRF